MAYEQVVSGDEAIKAACEDRAEAEGFLEFAGRAAARINLYYTWPSLYIPSSSLINHGCVRAACRVRGLHVPSEEGHGRRDRTARRGQVRRPSRRDQGKLTCIRALLDGGAGQSA